MPPEDVGSGYSTEENLERLRTRRTIKTVVLRLSIHRLQQIKLSAVLIFLVLGLAAECDAQVRETTLGIVRSLGTPGPFRFMKQFPDSDRTAFSFLLWNDRSQDLFFARVDSSFDSIVSEKHSLHIPFDDILIADLNNDLKPELVLLSKTERIISVVMSLAGDTLTITQSIRLPFAPTGWKVGDINNDGNADILLFDRNNPGIVILLGKANGTFVLGRSIAPELPVGAVALAHLNNDNLIDIVAYDWVKSQLHLLYGVGRARFLDQSTFQVQSDVIDILPYRLGATSNLDLVLVTAHPAEVQEWQGNGLGDFRLAKHAALDDKPVSYALGDLNGDQWTDFGYVSNPPSLQIIMNNGDEWSQDRIQFWAGTDPTSVAFRDFNNDGKTDAVVLDRAGQKLRFFFNGAQDNTLHDSLAFAAAPQPMGIVIHRAGSSSGNDLAVVNAQGRSLSLFSDRGPGGLLGQTSFSLSINPQFLTFHSLTDSTARFVLTSSTGDSLLLLSLNFRDSSSSYAVIPSEGSAQIVQFGINGSSQVEFFTFNTFSNNQNADIHYYERLDPGTFIDQSFHLPVPDELLGATAAFINSDKYPDLIYVYHNADSGNVDLAVSYGDSIMGYTQRHSNIELQKADSSLSYLWTGSFSHSDTTDLLVYFGPPSNILEEVRGKGNGQFEQPLVLLHGVELNNRSMLQVVDADNDGCPDIVLSNATVERLGWLRGNRDGSFQPWQPLVGVGPRAFFAVGDLNGDGIADVAVTNPLQGTIMVYNGVLMFMKGNDATIR